MPIRPIDLARAKLQGIQSALSKTPPSTKGESVSAALAGEFNQVVTELCSQFEDIGDALPKPIEMNGPFTELGVVELTFLDLEALCEQVLHLLKLVEDQ